MADLFADITPSLTSPAMDGSTILPNDTVPLTHVTRALYVGGSGDISAELVSGNQVSFTAVPGGMMLPLRISKILATGTTATGLVALW